MDIRSKVDRKTIERLVVEGAHTADRLGDELVPVQTGHCATSFWPVMLNHVIRPAERIARLLVLVGWMALITFWSSQGNLPIDQPMLASALHGFQHRLAHAVAFGLLALLARWAFDGLPRAALVAI